MKGFAANLTASRLEEMLASYVGQDVSDRDGADERKRENSAPIAKAAGHGAERTQPFATQVES